MNQQLVDLIKKLKQYQSSIYKLEPVQIAEYAKLKSNLLRQGVYITDELLGLPDEQIYELITRQIKSSRSQTSTPEAEYNYLDTITSVDTSIFDTERTEIRQQLFSNDVTLRITQSGKSFSVGWGASMKICKINIPTSWRVVMDQSLLLNLYDEVFGACSVNLDLDNVINLVKYLFERYQEFSAVKQILELELEFNKNMNLDDLNSCAYEFFRGYGLDRSTAIILAVLYDYVITSTLDLDTAKKWIGNTLATRTRLISSFEECINGSNCQN